MGFSWMKGSLLPRTLLFFLLIWPQPSDCKKTSLFEFSQHVKELNPESFEGIAKSTEAWAINFYSPGCPHCTRFAPTWEKVGDALVESSVRVGAVNCIKHNTFCRERSIHSYPTLAALNYPGAKPGTAAKPALMTLKPGHKSFDTVLNEIKGVFPCLAEERLATGNPLSPVRELGEDRQKKPGDIGCMLRLEDAIMSVRFSLKNEVFTEGLQLSDDRKEKFLNFLDLLATTFPGKDNRRDFRTLAMDLRRDPTLNNLDRWDSRIDNLKIGSFAPVQEFNWPAANIEKGTESGKIHFSNGLWSLFHVLSVSQAPSRQSPYDIMEGIYSFVTNFFRCQVCRDHFIGMYQTCENGRCQILKQGGIRNQQPEQGQTALALWVWRAHNAVNSRLATEYDNNVNMNLWPREEACQECWGGPPQEKGEVPWRETSVFLFLKKTYYCSSFEVKDQMEFESSVRSWAITCIAVCAGVLLLLWARRWQEMRGVGLMKKFVDTTPSL